MFARKFVLFFVLVQTCSGHIALTFPPARKYAFDFLDNARTQAPCGVPKGLGPETDLKAGATIDVTWHLSYPHQGGFYLEVRDYYDKVLQRYPDDRYFTGQNDTTTQSYQITLPNRECANCTLRMVRQAREWGNCKYPYYFWSCADINIKNDIANRDMCSGHGQYLKGRCFCEDLYIGNKCQYKEDCKENSDCANHGTCVNTMSTTYPKWKCYCNPGWFGRHCKKVSSVKSKPTTMEFYKKQEFSEDFKLYYRIIPDDGEIEMVMKVKTTTWAAVGWRPSSFKSGCQRFPWLPTRSVPETKPEPETTAEPETKAEPETTSEPESRSEPKTTSEPEPNAEPKSTAEPEPGATPETRGPGSKIKANPCDDWGVNTNPEPNPEGTAEPGSGKPEPETTAEPGHGKPEPETTAEPGHGKPEPETTAEPGHGKPEPETTAEPGHGKPEPETTAEPGHGKPEPETTAEPGHGKPEPETTAEPGHGKPEPETTAEPEGKPNPDNGNTRGGTPHPMDCTDIIIGSARNNQFRVGDYYTRDRSTPMFDEEYGGSDSLTGALGYEDDNMTVILFRRKLAANERTDYSFVKNEFMHVIWARGQDTGKYIHQPNSGLEIKLASDPNFYKEDELKYHGHTIHRGTASVNFYAVEPPKQPKGSCAGEWPLSCPNSGCPYKAMWTFDPVSDIISFTIQSRLGGEKKWIGIGFSDNRQMGSSDAVIGWVNSDGKVKVLDWWMSPYSKTNGVDKDSKQDLTGVTGKIENGVTEIKFSRKRNTADQNDFVFTDTKCAYFLFPANGGSYDHAGESVARHAATPSVSTDRICFRSTCSSEKPTTPTPTLTLFKVPASIRIIGVVFDNEYKDKTSTKYMSLKKDIEDGVKPYLSANFEKAEVVNMRPGSIIVDLIVHSSVPKTDENTKAALKKEVEMMFGDILKKGMLRGFQVDKEYLTVSEPYTGDDHDHDKDHGTGLTKVEWIIIGFAVALCVVALVLVACKCYWIHREKSIEDRKKLKRNGSDSTESYDMQKSGHHLGPYDIQKKSPYASSESQLSTITYDEFLDHVKRDPSGKNFMGSYPRPRDDQKFNVYVP